MFEVPAKTLYERAVERTNGGVSHRSYYVGEAHPGRSAYACDNLRDQGFVVLMPTYERSTIKRGVLRSVSYPIFSTYLFIAWDAGARWQAVNGTPGMKGLITGSRAMAAPECLPMQPIAPRYAALLESMCSDDGKSVTEDAAKQFVGQMIRLVGGPFASFEGRCDSVERGVAVVMVHIFGRETRYEDVPTSWLELAS